MPTAIIADDEPALVAYLKEKLARLWPELTVLATAGNGREALALADQHQPDIAFLDIHMPGLSGLDVAAQLPDGTRVVFVTAFDEHAVSAFEHAAVDYLLKPVSDERLEAALARLREQPAAATEEILQLLRAAGAGARTHLQWLRTGLDDTTELVSVNEVIYFQSGDKYTTVVTRQGKHLLRLGIAELEKQLDQDLFWRVHRGTIVRVDQILSARRDLRGGHTLTLKDLPDTLRSSRSYGHLFRKM